MPNRVELQCALTVDRWRFAPSVQLLLLESRISSRSATFGNACAVDRLRRRRDLRGRCWLDHYVLSKHMSLRVCRESVAYATWKLDLGVQVSLKSMLATSSGK
jgi:hypothetical protein